MSLINEIQKDLEKHIQDIPKHVQFLENIHKDDQLGLAALKKICVQLMVKLEKKDANQQKREEVFKAIGKKDLEN